MSTGGTITCIVKGLMKIGACEKYNHRGKGPERVRGETGCDVKTLADIEVKQGEVHILRID